MYQDQPSNRRSKAIATVVTLVVVVLIVFGISVFSKKDSSVSGATLSDTTTTPVQTTATTTPTPVAAVTPSSSQTYKDGTYSTTVTYASPGGEESIGVSITLAGDTITNSDVTSGANDGEAQSYQDAFISSYKDFVIGKKIAGLGLSRVSGASLTSRGFNNALAEIANQAKV